MNEHVKKAADAVLGKFGGEISEFRGDITIHTDAENILSSCQFLRDEYDFKMLVDITAVDYWPELEPRYHLVYHLRSIPQQCFIELRVPVSDEACEIETLEGVFPNANWYERELFDMFGFDVKNHSDLRRIVLPHDWEGHPLRKDYPLGYEEVQFTFNYEEINQQKKYAEE